MGGFDKDALLSPFNGSSDDQRTQVAFERNKSCKLNTPPN
jgi:hypothetical protein